MEERSGRCDIYNSQIKIFILPHRFAIAISVHINVAGRGYAVLLQQPVHSRARAEHGLRGDVIDAEGLAKLDVLDSLLKGTK